MMFKRWYVKLCKKMGLSCQPANDKHVFRKAREVADPEIEDMIRSEVKLRARIIAERNKK